MPKKSSEAELIFNIVDILRKNVEIVGEVRFLDYLREKGTGTSPRRFRRIIYDIPEIDVSVKYSEAKFKKLDKCPVCSSRLRAIRNMNLEGKRKVIGYRCMQCGYNSISNGKPYIYTFRLKHYDFRHRGELSYHQAGKRG